MTDFTKALAALDRISHNVGKQAVCCERPVAGHPGDDMTTADPPTCCREPDEDVDHLIEEVRKAIAEYQAVSLAGDTRARFEAWVKTRPGFEPRWLYRRDAAPKDSDRYMEYVLDSVKWMWQAWEAKDAGVADGEKLWLWQNGDHFLAFRNLYPCYSPGGDPMTLGEPFGYALFKESHNRSGKENS